jgi:hypothetical protein
MFLRNIDICTSCVWLTILLETCLCKPTNSSPYTLQPWRWSQNVPPKRRYPLTGLHSAHSEDHNVYSIAYFHISLLGGLAKITNKICRHNSIFVKIGWIYGRFTRRSKCVSWEYLPLSATPLRTAHWGCHGSKVMAIPLINFIAVHDLKTPQPHNFNLPWLSGIHSKQKHLRYTYISYPF